MSNDHISDDHISDDHISDDATSDLRLGAFREDGPWVVDPPTMAWRHNIERIRAATHSEVPRLLRARRVPPGGRVVAVAGRVGLALGAWARHERGRGGPTSRAGLSRRLRRAFERLGPTYVKLGQIVSSGEGIFPEELVNEFRLLRDKVPPERWVDIRRIIESELGRPLEAVFAHVDETPLAAASIAQVHAATLLTGEQVVVKVQRPSVERLVRRDLAAMAWLAPLLVGRIPVSALANPPALVELFAETIVEELDFRLEAENMLDIARVLAATDQRSLVVPRPHPTLVTRRVLVMERLDGFAFDDVAGMHAAGIDTSAVVRAGLVAVLEGAVLFGVFHGDLHGGNLFVMADGRVALLDYGITGRLDERRRLAFLRLLMGGTINDVRMQLGALIDLGALPEGTDLDAVVPRPRPRPAGQGPDDDVGRRAGAGDARADQVVARVRRAPAQGAHALREGPAVPLVGDLPPGPRRRPAGRGDLHRHLLRPRPRRADHPRRGPRPARSRSTSTGCERRWA